MDKNMLVELLEKGNTSGDEQERTIGCRIEDMREEDIKEAVIEFVYNRWHWNPNSLNKLWRRKVVKKENGNYK